jgi:drug/metabolite transporter (DMT)-like permease
MHARTLSILQMLLAMGLAGTSVVPARVLSRSMPVFTAGLLSMLFALAVLVPLFMIFRRRRLRLSRADLGLMFLQALFGIVLFRVLFMLGLGFTSAASAGVIASSTPAVMAALSRLIFGERLGARRLAGVCLGGLGVCLVNLAGAASDASDAGTNAIAGNLLVFGAIVSEALLTVFRKKASASVDALTNTLVLCAMSAGMLAPLALAEILSVGLPAIGRLEWAALVYYGACTTTLAYLLWGTAAPRLPVSATGLATTALPVAACLAAALVLDETLLPAQLAGCAAAVAGILLGAGSPAKCERDRPGDGARDISGGQTPRRSAR